MSRAFIQKRLPFKPTDIGGCQLWLDAADATTVTGTTTVTQWRDKSVNARNLGVGSGTTSYANNAITLNSSYMFVTSAVNLTSVTVFIVVKTTGGNNQTVFEGRPNTNVDYDSLDGFGFYMDGTSSVRFYAQSGGGQFSTFGVNTSSPRLFSFQSIGTSVSGWYGGASQSGGTLSSTRTSTAQGFAIGAYWDGSGYYNIIANVSLYEIIVYNSDVSTNQRQQVESYLAQKWGLKSTLSQGHPGTRGIVYPSDPVNLLVRLPYPSAFVPTTAGDCQLWLDAADSTTLTGTSPVTAWRDKSGKSRNTTSYAGTPALTTNAINGVQAINFNGSSSFTGSIPGSGKAYTLFYVGNFNASSGAFAGLVCFSSPGNQDYAAGGITNTKLSDTSVYSTVNGANTVFTTNTLSIPFIYSLVIDGTYINNFVNGTQQTPADRAQSGTFNFTNYVVANRAGSTGNYPLNGYVGEIIVYLNGLATLQRQQVEGYLAWKWGLQGSLDASNPYKAAAPSVQNQLGISRPANVPIPPITIYAGPRPIGITGANSSNIVNGYYFYYFTSPTATAIINVPGKNITVFALGGGGGGGYFVGGGGGAGGLQTLTSALNGSYTVTVGNGGAGSTGPYSTGPPGSNGSNTTFVGGAVSITALGGGGGGTTFNVAGANGGCGGGAPYGNSSYGTGSQGYNGQPAPNGGLSGGGGGIGGAGGHGGLNKDGGYGYGGTAISTYLDGNQYGGGGGAGNNNPGNETGGFATSGGGAGALDSTLYGDVPSSYAKSGTANKGAGGGGGGNGSTTLNTGAAGGSGIVILSYVYP